MNAAASPCAGSIAGGPPPALPSIRPRRQDNTSAVPSKPPVRPLDLSFLKDAPGASSSSARHPLAASVPSSAATQSARADNTGVVAASLPVLPSASALAVLRPGPPPSLPSSSGHRGVIVSEAAATNAVANEAAAASAGASTPLTLSLQRRIAMLESRVAPSAAKVNPLSAWPQSKPPPATALTTVGAGSLIASSGARPPLALEIEAFIRRELQALHAAVPRPTPLQRLPVVREALGCFSSHFSEYAPTLGLIRQHYDAAVDEMSVLAARVQRLSTENRSLKETFAKQMERERENLGTEVRDLRAQLTASQKYGAAQSEAAAAAVRDCMRLQQQARDRAAECDEANERLKQLSNTLREQSAKTAKLVTGTRRLAQENERLLHVCVALEHRLVAEQMDGSSEPHQPISGGGIGRSGAGRGNRGVPTALGGTARISPVPSGDAAAATLGSAGGDGSSSGLVGAALGRTAATTRRFGPAHDDIDGALALVAGANTNGRGGANGMQGPPGSGAFEDDVDARERVLELEEKIRKLTRLNHLLLAEHKAAQERVAQLQQSKDNEAMTPRPKWATVTETLPDFVPLHLATSAEILEELIAYFRHKQRDDLRLTEIKAYSTTVRQWLGEEDMVEGDLGNKGKYFVGKGTGPHVPLYLRHRGHVRNRRMKKGDVENLLKKFWADRRNRVRADSHLNATPIADYFFEWLLKETPSHQRAIELAYNMHTVCEANQHDPDCSMFLRIMRGEISEFVIYDQLEVIERLREIIASQDKPRPDGSRKGTVPRVVVLRILTKVFPAKSSDDMLRLRFALITFCHGGHHVDYNALFREDAAGNQTRFVEVLRHQHLQEISTFTVDIEETLREELLENGMLDTGRARSAIKALDPGLTIANIDEMLAYACGMSLDEFAPHGERFAVPAEPALARMRCGVLVKRRTRRDNGSDDDDDRAGGPGIGAGGADGDDAVLSRGQRVDEIGDLLRELDGEGGLEASLFASPGLAASASVLSNAGRRSLQQRRSIAAAEAQHAESQDRALRQRQRDEKEAAEFAAFGSKFGIGAVNRQALRLASDMTRVQSSLTMGGMQRSPPPETMSPDHPISP